MEADARCRAAHDLSKDCSRLSAWLAKQGWTLSTNHLLAKKGCEMTSATFERWKYELLSPIVLTEEMLVVVKSTNGWSVIWTGDTKPCLV